MSVVCGGEGKGVVLDHDTTPVEMGGGEERYVASHVLRSSSNAKRTTPRP